MPASTHWSQNLLHQACSMSGHGSTQIIRFLLSQPEVDPNALDRAGRTPLMVACDDGGHPGAVQILLADDRTDVNKGNPLALALLFAHVDIVRLFLASGRPVRVDEECWRNLNFTEHQVDLDPYARFTDEIARNNLRDLLASHTN